MSDYLSATLAADPSLDLASPQRCGSNPTCGYGSQSCLCRARRGRLLPDPRYDAVRVIALATLDDAEEVPDGAFATRCLLHCADAGSPPADALHGIQVTQIPACCIAATVIASMSVSKDVAN